MKNKTIFFICISLLAFNFVRAQETKFTGKIIDKVTKEPVFGATIFYSGRAMSFSDETGYFQLMLSKPELNDSITISHFAYKIESIPLSDIKSDSSLICIEERVYAMDEITVKPINAGKVLKEIKKRYRLSYPQLSHWAEVNYSQLISYKGRPCSYLECFGNMLLIGDKEKNPFVGSYCIPSQVRRTKEDLLLAKVVFHPVNPGQRIQVSGNYVYIVLTEYHFFEVCQPLNSNFANSFEFHLDSISTVNGTSCYLFSYKQKNKISCLGNKIYGMKGQIWADITNYNLVKITGIFNRGDLFSNQIVEEFNSSGNTLYPKNISLQIINNKYLGDKFLQKVFIESNININKIDAPERDYARKSGYYIESYLPSMKYNKDFWNQHPIDNSYLKTKVSELIGENSWDAAFEIGSQEKVFEDNKYFDSIFKGGSDKTIEIMKRDLKMN